MKWYKHKWSWLDADWRGIFLSVYNDPLVMTVVLVVTIDFIWRHFIGW